MYPTLMTKTLVALALSLASFLPSLSVLAAGREIAPPPLAPTGYGSLQPTAAFAGNRFLTVWWEQMGDIGRYFKAAFSDASGQRVSPAAFTLLQHEVNPDWMQLVGTGDAYALFWRQQGATYMTDIDLEGRPTRTVTLDVPASIVAEASWNGERFLLALRLPAGIVNDAEGVLLDRDGTVVRRQIGLYDLSWTFDIVPTATGFVAFSAGDNLNAHSVANDGALQIRLIEPAEGTSATAVRPRAVVATTLANGDIMAVWSAIPGTYQSTQLRSVTLRSDGTVSGILPVATRDGILTPLHLTKSGDGAVLAYTRQNLHQPFGVLMTQRIAATGAAAGEAVEGPRIAAPNAAANGNLTFVAGSVGTPFTPRVSSIAVAADASQGAPEMLSILPARQTQPVLASASGRVLAAWGEISGDAAALRTAILDAGGHPVHLDTVAPAFLGANEVSWNGSEFLAVTYANGELRALRIDANGAAIDAQPIVLGTVNSPWWQRAASVTWAGDRWIVVWPDEEHVRFATVSPAGVPTAPIALAIETPLPDQWYRYIPSAAVAYDGTRVLLVWNEERQPFCWFPVCSEGEALTLVTRLTRDGDPIGTQQLSIPTAQAFELSAATSGNELVVLVGSKLTSVDTRAETMRVLATREQLAGAGDVQWDGQHYVLAQRFRLYQFHLTLRRLDANLNDAAPARGVMTLAPDILQAPSVAGPLIGIQEGTVETGGRAVVYRESDLPLLVPAPGKPRNVRTRATAVNEFELTWDAPAGEVEQYVIEGLTAGDAWAWVAILPSHIRGVRSPFATMRVRAVNAGGTSEWATPGADGTGRRRAVRH
jgi:hypothetical protein